MPEKTQKVKKKSECLRKSQKWITKLRMPAKVLKKIVKKYHEVK